MRIEIIVSIIVMAAGLSMAGLAESKTFQVIGATATGIAAIYLIFFA